jgi:hypothetical protein
VFLEEQLRVEKRREEASGHGEAQQGVGGARGKLCGFGDRQGQVLQPKTAQQEQEGEKVELRRREAMRLQLVVLVAAEDAAPS